MVYQPVDQGKYAWPDLGRHLVQLMKSAVAGVFGHVLDERNVQLT